MDVVFGKRIEAQHLSLAYRGKGGGGGKGVDKGKREEQTLLLRQYNPLAGEGKRGMGRKICHGTLHMIEILKGKGKTLKGETKEGRESTLALATKYQRKGGGLVKKGERTSELVLSRKRGPCGKAKKKII